MVVVVRVVVVVVVRVAVVFVVLIVHGDDGMQRRQPAAQHGLEREGVPVDRQLADDGHDLQRVGAGVHQRGHGHIARRTGEAVEPCCRRVSVGVHLHILVTAQAAPNPLSIPTTVTPLAHDACIANSAVTPSSAAP
ncbi:unannotated protein [freshwater metagenome]|uniref:Unannotated protein n=1 Tax=freshwater metagenome TaxID=449393 RepID=A0A6J7QVS5_9ZZZZ